MEKERKINKLRNKVKFNKKLIENEKKKNKILIWSVSNYVIL